MLAQISKTKKNKTITTLRVVKLAENYNSSTCHKGKKPTQTQVGRIALERQEQKIHSVTPEVEKIFDCCKKSTHAGVRTRDFRRGRLNH